MSVYDEIKSPVGRPGLNGMPRHGSWNARFSRAVASSSAPVFVIVEDLDDHLEVGPCKWAKTPTPLLPAKDDPCLVIFDNRNTPWIASWEPAVPATSFNPDDSIFGRKIKFSEGVAPPGSPQVNDLWLFHPVTGISWLFRYEPDQDVNFPWQFTGGAAWRGTAGSLQTTSAAYVSAGPSFTCARAGVYHTIIGGRLYIINPSNNAASLDMAINGVASGLVIGQYQGLAGANITLFATHPSRMSGDFTVAAGAVLNMVMRSDDGASTATSDNRQMEVQPVRVA